MSSALPPFRFSTPWNVTTAVPAVSGRSGDQARLLAVKVLVVEDDARIAAAVRRGLEAEGFGVAVATDGPEGLWMAAEGAYDVMFGEE